MSNINIVTTIRAFLGDAESGAQCVADAIERGLYIALVDGTKAPIEAAIAEIAGLTPRAKKNRALTQGMSALCDSLSIKEAQEIFGLGVGKFKGRETAAIALARDASEAFMVAVATVLTVAPRALAVKTGAQIAARALKALASLSAREFAAAIASAQGADMLTRAACAALTVTAGETVKKTAAAVATAKTALSIAMENAMAPATV